MITWLKWTGIGLLLGAAMGVLAASGVFDVISFFDPHTTSHRRRHLFDWTSKEEYWQRFQIYPIYFAIGGAVLGGIIGWRKMRAEQATASGAKDERGADDAPPSA